MYAAMHILPSHRDGERRTSEGDPEGAFGSPQREPTARDTAEWWRPLGATECSRSRVVGGVSGALEAKLEHDVEHPQRLAEVVARAARRPTSSAVARDRSSPRS